ncbi:hypothetical protein SAMN04490244_110111 [Tranquillimonas rosea]|uniref:Uncharacterized protein n=1 Tax=Tranquillimonas rosea TaxID=641238 RepID=A0A1H9WFF6_9RHOB|nr:hypothetical protein [Tranquillimonas rosea]SES32193.1 hypothetical protein SAMN04490244_110111 [Tranquillimonas rosea]
MIGRALFLVFALALPASAQSPMSAAEFEDYVSGKTLTFATGGVTYGMEEYLSDRRVRWSFLDGECKEGVWYQRGEQICFEYEDGTGPQCWTFYRDAGSGLRARFAGDPAGTELYETEATDAPMQCPGPRIGV